MSSEEKDTNSITAVNNRLIGTKVATFIAICLALFQLLTAYFGALTAMEQRSIHISLVLAMIFLLQPSSKRYKGLSMVFDWLLVVVSLAMGLYIYLMTDKFTLSAVELSRTDILVGILGMFIIIEGTRRIMGLALPLIAMFFLAYSYVGPYLPSIIGHRGFSMEKIVYHMFFTTEGILGVPLGVSATFVAMFIIFAAFLGNSGAGNFFIQSAYSMVGQFRGGPAKISVISSSLFGMISGSAVANVMVDGWLTIPLMKRSGFKGHAAGAIEAVASTGGQIMPPIMGAGAFIMVEFLGIPYIRIAIAATIPALLYYFALYIMIDREAVQMGLLGLPRDELPRFAPVFRRGWPFLVPIFVLVYLLTVQMKTPSLAAFWATIVTLGVGCLHPDIKLRFKGIIDCLAEGGMNLLEVASACAVAGIIIGVISLTGLGMKLATLLIYIAGGHKLTLLILTAAVCYVLGMGMPTTAAYLIVATLVAPALIKMGIVPLAAHLFVFYYSIVSMITPPVALAAYAAAGIAEANPTQTGFTAMRFGITLLIVPFFFVYSPELLLIGKLPNIILKLLIVTISIYFLSVGVHGCGWFGKLKLVPRILLIGGSLLLIRPDLITDLVGLGICATGVMLARLSRTDVESQAQLSRLR